MPPFLTGLDCGHWHFPETSNICFLSSLILSTASPHTFLMAQVHNGLV